MIIDLNRFITEERPFWTELEQRLDEMEKDPVRRMDLSELKRFHYLYQRASADLARIETFSAEVNLRVYLESLVARAYGEIHENRSGSSRFAPKHWFFRTFPRAFRRHLTAFWTALIIFSIGGVFGGLALSLDPDAKAVLMPFSHLKGDPSERVEKEEKAIHLGLEERKASFSSYLMTHNTKVSIFALALGMTWGFGTVVVLFSNGVMLGAVAVDYLLAGETRFLLGWLLPHGAVEIPAILLASQAGLVLAGAMIGRGQRISFRTRFRKVSGDLVTLIFGTAVLLVWAGFIEAFLSQYHEPVIPYALKIGFGTLELILLFIFLGMSGRKKTAEADGRNPDHAR
ncbi:MAG: stage II sporulation protein M [Thermodesulfobacteriota bacterium]